MTVAELIEELNKVEDKDTQILVWDDELGGYCKMVCIAKINNILTNDFYQVISLNNIER